MERDTRDKIVRRTVLGVAIIAMAILFLGASFKKLDLKLHKDGRGAVGIEVVHKPHPDDRSIYVEGIVEFEDAPPYTSQSAWTVEGDSCPIIHRITWRNIPEGILKVEVRIRDAENKDRAFVVKQIMVSR